MQRQKLEGMGGRVGVGECASPSASSLFWNARSFDLMSNGQSPVSKIPLVTAHVLLKSRCLSLVISLNNSYQISKLQPILGKIAVSIEFLDFLVQVLS